MKYKDPATGAVGAVPYSVMLGVSYLQTTINIISFVFNMEELYFL